MKLMDSVFGGGNMDPLTLNASGQRCTITL
jgi:hypothetical protein